MSSSQPFPGSRVVGEDDADEVLVERCLDGDAAAFTLLVKRYQRPIYNAAYRVLGRDEDAGDVAQTVFLKVAEHMRDFDPSHRFFSWIYRIAMNESLNLLRRNNRDQPMDEDAEYEGPESLGPEHQAVEAENSRRIQKALLGMKPADRAVIALRHFSDCSYEEIAQILEIDVKTVKSRLFEARTRMRSLLSDLRPSRGAATA
jgi:RNA polymerase sigma-70 factor (ECF subfamily)